MNRKCLVVVIILLFIGTVVIPVNGQTIGKSAPRIHFNSYVKIEYDQQYVNHTFIREIAYAIPVNIGYRADVPPVLLHSNSWLFQLLINWILFRSFIAPSAIINVTTENVPSWAVIYPSSPTIFLPIDNEWTIASFVVIVIIHSQAPSGPFPFTLNAETPALHRINGYFISTNITITVQ